MKIALWIVGVIAALALAATTLLFIQNRKLKSISSADSVQKYIDSLPIYQNDVDAKANGMVAGERYRKSATATDYEIVAAA